MKKFRKENTQTVMALNEDLANEEWNDIFGEKDVNKAYENFINKLTYYYDKNIPLVKSKQHNRKPKIHHHPRYITFNKNRNKLYKSCICKPSEHSLKKYKQYRNKLTDIIRTLISAVIIQPMTYTSENSKYWYLRSMIRRYGIRVKSHGK